MATGFGLLHLSPRDFWSMTPREMSAAITALTGRLAPAAAPSRCELTALMRRYPDARYPGAQGSKHE
jgi:uncharacterized phage protein (TIGR02216 family)